MKIRSHLLFLVLGTLLPILAFSAAMTAVFWREQRQVLEQRFVDRVRGMTIALDREIDGNIRSLQMLAESPHLQSNDLLSFHEQIVRALSTQGTWANIILSDPISGRQVINLRYPFGKPLPETLLDKTALAAVVKSGRPFVSPISQGGVGPNYMTAIVVPAKTGSGRPYTLMAAIVQLPSCHRCNTNFAGSKRDHHRAHPKFRTMGRSSAGRGAEGRSAQGT
jgi:hypothetical protein